MIRATGCVARLRGNEGTMGHVTVTLNGRAYRLRCGDGEEERLARLSGYVGKKIDHLVAQFGQVGDDRLTVLAALLITDELFEAREGRAKEEGEADGAADDAPPVAKVSAETPATPASPLSHSKSEDIGPAEDPDDQLENDSSRPEPLLKRALRRSQARAARSPLSIEERLAAAREGLPSDLKTGSD